MMKEEFQDGGMQWDIPGGRMEPGEIFLQTLTRELREEIDVDGLETAKHFATTLSNKQVRTENGAVGLVLVLFRVTLKDGAMPKALEKSVTLSWLPINDAADLLLDKYPGEFVDKILCNTLL